MSSKTELAKAAAAVVAPEAVVPLELLERVLRAVRPVSEQKTEGPEGAVLVPPPREFLITTREQRVRVTVRKGVKLVIVEPAAGVNAKDLALLAAVGGTGFSLYLAYELAKHFGADVSAFAELPESIVKSVTGAVGKAGQFVATDFGTSGLTTTYSSGQNTQAYIDYLRSMGFEV
jgi:hypothetical protein